MKKSLRTLGTAVGGVAILAATLVAVATPAEADIPCPDGSTVPVGSFCPLFTLPTVTSTVTVVSTTIVTTTVTVPAAQPVVQCPGGRTAPSADMCGPIIN